MVYKIIYKVLANHLKMILYKCVSPNQFAFIEGRSILDNAYVAFEIIHFLKSKTEGKLGDVALKIDFSKTYDRLDCGYIKWFL